MSDHDIKTKIKDYFSTNKYAKKIIDERKNQLIIINENGDKIIAYIFDNQLNDRNRFLNTVLNASTKLSEHNFTYLAMPKIYSSMIDIEVIKKFGLGLLTYNHRIIDEVLAPRYFKIDNQNNAPVKNDLITEKMKEFEVRLESLNKIVERLSSEIMELKIKNVEKTPEVKSFINPTEYEENSEQSDPLFFKDNPWMEVLSQRGRE